MEVGGRDGDAYASMQYDARKKSLLVAYLLWYFLGPFGAHRFYLGRQGSAIAQLLVTIISVPLCFLLIGFIGLAVIGIWWLVDAFLIPAMAEEFNLGLISSISSSGYWRRPASSARREPSF